MIGPFKIDPAPTTFVYPHLARDAQSDMPLQSEPRGSRLEPRQSMTRRRAGEHGPWGRNTCMGNNPMRLLLTIAFIGLSTGAFADERSMKTAMGECFFVLLSGQPVERRFPDATPVPGDADAVQEVRGDTTAVVSVPARSCWITDTAVTVEQAGEMAEDIARRGRITDLESTTVGRGESAVSGRFNDRPVLISWTWGPQGGAKYTVRVDQ